MTKRRWVDNGPITATKTAGGLLLSLYLNGRSVAQIVDGPLLIAMQRIGKLWRHQVLKIPIIIGGSQADQLRLPDIASFHVGSSMRELEAMVKGVTVATSTR